MIRRSVIISDEKIDSFISAVLDRSHAGIPDPEMAFQTILETHDPLDFLRRFLKITMIKDEVFFSQCNFNL